ncbi:MAG: adenylosuccinate lyase [Planctomycetota bacterium]
MSDHSTYANPLITRYASREMAGIWSAQTKHATWRKLWVALAEGERELGLDISEGQIVAMRAAVDDIDFDLAATYERDFRHDVMAHVHTFGDRVPEAKGIIHLGATSCFVTDNSELIQLRSGLELIERRLAAVIVTLADFCDRWKTLPCLGFTHLQAAQPTTVGKRATLWCYDLVLGLEEVRHRLKTLRFRGVKGTTGTQATFLKLFDGDHDKVRRLDEHVRAAFGFEEGYAVTGQTYPRVVDAQVLHTLSGLAASCHKWATDLRVLQHRKEIDEPFGEKQIGSSAMAYKRNPMKAERVCALARFAMSLATNGEATAATQWLERTLDDSANRRLSLPQSFLAVDACLNILREVADGMVVYPQVVAAKLAEELPFMATEEVLMAGVAAGGDRQELHEAIRVHSVAAAAEVKEHGRSNDLIDRLKGDPLFASVDLESTLDPARYVGRSAEQVEEFLGEIVGPLRERYGDALNSGSEDRGV